MPRVETSVVVPVYRNADTLEELHARLVAALEPRGRPFELLFVDDASPDGSAALLRDLAARDGRVGVVSLARNAGQHRAVLAGLARASGGTAVVLDADLQDPPEVVPRLLEALGPDAAAVFAGRRGRYESIGRLATSKIFKTLLHLVSGTPIDGGMFVAMSRAMVDRILAAAEADPFVPALLGEAGLPTRSLPVRRHERPRGESAYSGGKRLATGLRALGRAFARRLGRRAAPGAAPHVEVAALIGGPFGTGAAE